MATVHFIQQGKGGVGKSVIASFLYQVLRHREKDVVAYDTDPVNATLLGYKEFKVVPIDIVRQGQVDARAFDELLEGLYSLPEGSHAIVDNGASSFLALGNYIKDIGLIQLLEEQGHHVYFHSVVTGGQAIGDTISGLKVLADGFAPTPIVVWLNPFFGEIRLDGKAWAGVANITSTARLKRYFFMPISLLRAGGSGFPRRCGYAAPRSRSQAWGQS